MPRCGNFMFLNISFLSIMLASCGGSDSSTKPFDDVLNCTGHVAFGDPLVEIISVTDGSNGDDLVQVTLSQLKINGQENLFESSVVDINNMHNIDVVDNMTSAICTIPCGLFNQEAEYSMQVSSPSFEPKNVEFEAEYSTLDVDTCPTTYLGSYELSVELYPEGFTAKENYY